MREAGGAVGRSSRQAPDLAPGPARDLVDLFARLRATNRLTGGQIAMRTHRSASYISEVTRGVKAPSPEVASEIARVLGAKDHDILRARLFAEQLIEVKRHRQQGSPSSRSGSEQAPLPLARTLPLRGRIRVTLAVTVVGGLLAAIGLTLAPSGSTGGTWVTGSVTCQSGRPVVGIWIAATAGQLDSGYAHLGPAPHSRLNYASGPTVTYSYRLAESSPYAVHVGCGGTANAWASKNFSDLTSQLAVTLRCDDPRPALAGRTTLIGSCTMLS